MLVDSTTVQENQQPPASLDQAVPETTVSDENRVIVESTLFDKDEQNGESDGETEYEGNDSKLIDVEGSAESLTISQTKRGRKGVRYHLNIGMDLFNWPRARYNWGDQQHEAHTVWGSLFFDLIFVGVAYQLGKFISDSLKHENFLGGLGLFIVLYEAMENYWMTKLMFDGRFDADDLFHRVWQIVIGAIVSLAANTINYEKMMDSQDRSILNFSCCMLMFTLVECIPFVEISRQYPASNVKRFANKTLSTRLITLPFIIASIINSALGGPLWVTALFWLIASQVFRIRLIFSVLMKTLKREDLVPLHVDFIIHRQGEYFMLMLGESIISIIIVELRSSASFIVTFLLCYFLVATLSMLVFNALPSHPDQHAMRRSVLRSTAYFILFSIQNISLILCGTGFKLLLTSVDLDDAKLTPYAWLVSGSLTVLTLTLFIGRVLHHGIGEEFWLLSTKGKKMKRICFWILKVLGALLFLVAPAMNASCWGLMLYFVCIALFLLTVQLVDLRAFEEHHRMLIELEVKERIARFAKEKAEAEQPHQLHHVKQS